MYQDGPRTNENQLASARGIDMATIAELLLEQGRQQASERQRQGDIRGSMWQNLAQIAAQYGKNVQQQQIEAPIRAQEAQMRGLQIQNAQSDIAAKARATDEDKQFRDLLHGDQPPTSAQLLAVNPERGAHIAEAMSALSRDPIKEQDNIQSYLQKVTLGINALPESERGPAYEDFYTHAVTNKIFPAGTAPSKYDPKKFQEMVHYAQQLPKAEPYTLKPGEQRFNADNTVAASVAAEPPKLTPPEQELDAYAKSINKKGRADLTFDDMQAFTAKKTAANLTADMAKHAAQRQYDIANPTKDGTPDQTKLEQNYRTILSRAMSSRSGGIGLEDAKVQQANHLISVLDQFYDAKTGQWNIPRVQLNELALGLARLTSPGGQAGEGMLREFQQRTAAGDVAGALTYLTGQPVAANTQAITAMLKDSIERQGKTAEQNREGEMRYLRGLAPTELDDDRRQKLEATSLNPLRQSRVIANPTTKERKLQVSIDGGKTWQ